MLTTTPRDTSRRDSNGHTPLSRQNHAKAKVQILEKWFVDHLEYPYPTEEEKEELLDIAQMNRRQLDNWFINARRPERKEKFIARANAHKVPSPSSQPRKHSWESIPLESPPPSKRQKSIKPEDTTNIRPSSPIKLDADPAIKVDLNSTPTLIESVSIIKPNEDGAIPPPPLKKMKAHHYKEPRIIQMEVYPPINSASSIFATAPKAATAVSR
ncbi:hypothetical protein HK097_001861 [Rhizophlyctis rosea]|uniref:Homeobox domain-containing protein n=1 Tax=Rhizophlyctis rosea TaxID=64517 RepID=A0AAD5S4Z8_9FUNG|nr:hypothetical protein HK097_001861 [Rhizophlyctis rosea]